MKSLLLSLLVLASTSLMGQGLVLASASSQAWAGGVCCTYGVDYAFTLQGGRAETVLVLDTLWIGLQWYTASGTSRVHTAVTYNASSQTHTISAGYRVNQYEDYFGDDMQRLPRFPSYKGEALLVCHADGRRKVIVVPAIAELPPIPFP